MLSVPDTIEGKSLGYGLSIGLLFAISLFFLKTFRRQRSNFPPGPYGLPILGNALDLRKDPWLKFTLWKETYGPIVYFRVIGRPVVVVNTFDAAVEILDGRAVSTSARPPWIVANKLSGGQFLPFINSQTQLWRDVRRIYHEGFRPARAHDLESILYREALVFCARLLTQPPARGADTYPYFQHYISSTSLSIIYGHSSKFSESINPICITLDQSILRILNSLTHPHPVEIFPWLDYVPSRFAPWKRNAQKLYLSDSAIVRDLLEGRRLSRDKTSGGAIADLIIAAVDKGTLSETDASWSAFGLYIGMQTTAGVLSWALLALILYPDIQQRARVELNRVVGYDRPPTFADFDDLPYIQALVKEVLRWRSVVPLGLPHTASEDIYYQGYLIPKGAMLLANVWAINRDHNTFGPDATEFRPDRYIDADTGKLRTAFDGMRVDGHVSFGFGRRVCPGRSLGNKMLFISLAMMIWALDMQREQELEGEPVHLEIDGCIDEGIVVRPLPFGCIFKPRFSGALDLLQNCMTGAGVAMT